MRLAILLCAAACAGGSTAQHDATTPADADPNALSVAGSYATEVTLAQSSCDGITVEPRPTSVAHTPGAATLTVTHAGNSYAGTIQRDGAFATTPRQVGGGGETHTLTITGRFSTTGFTATVAAHVVRTGAADCDYTVEWVGTRTAGVNVIPG